jgi:hypothetical protein
MKKFSLIVENKEFEGRGNLMQIIKSLLDDFNIWEENKDFFNDYLPQFLDEVPEDLYDDSLADTDRLGKFYKTDDWTYAELRQFIWDEFKDYATDPDIDRMSSTFLEIIYLEEMINKLEKRNVNAFKKMND